MTLRFLLLFICLSIGTFGVSIGQESLEPSDEYHKQQEPFQCESGRWIWDCVDYDHRGCSQPVKC